MKNYLDKLLGNPRLLYGLGTAFIIVIMAYSGYAVLRANVAPITACLCFFPAALAALFFALISRFGNEDCIADLPYGLRGAARLYYRLASALIGSALMVVFGLIILPLVMFWVWIDEMRS